MDIVTGLASVGGSAGLITVTWIVGKFLEGKITEKTRADSVTMTAQKAATVSMTFLQQALEGQSKEIHRLQEEVARLANLMKNEVRYRRELQRAIHECAVTYPETRQFWNDQLERLSTPET